MDRTLDYSELVSTLRTVFGSHRMQPIDWRLHQLKRLNDMLAEQEAALTAALYADLKKPALEAYLAEIGFVASGAQYARKHLGNWVKRHPASTPMVLQPGRSHIVWEPLGVALIIGAWNHPLQLTLAPLVPAIAAGNCAVIKPSEMSPASSAALAELLPRYLDSDCFTVVEGGSHETQSLLAQQFDKIFFTGNGVVGRIVMSAAARHLTPVTLELGGKTPCIVDSQVNMKAAARRIVSGKFTNAGQTCVAPDYVLVHASRYEEFLHEVKATLIHFYGDDPERTPDYARIINRRHHDRLTALLSSGRAFIGGGHHKEGLYIAPTVLTHVAPDAPVMREEIFGPILPVMAARDMDEVVRFVNGRDKPLALYLFTENSATVARIARETSSGGMCVNDTLFHVSVPELPFGGVGPSGMGKYHGEWGFRDFSHAKAVLNHSTLLDPDFRYPPYTERKKKLLRWVMYGG